MRRMVITLLFILMMASKGICSGEKWLISAYCSCKKCCGKSNGITASGKVARWEYVACNWLKFGTVVEIKGLGRFIVMDRGAKSKFGSKTNHIKHLDVWFPTHKQAKEFGVQWREVMVYEK
jgi:3D (Asp-Asp-Asp) domain-containing protein